MTPEERKEQQGIDTIGKQGNEGLYGQGQYDSEGNPDLTTKQAQQLMPDPKQPAPLKPEEQQPTPPKTANPPA